MKVAICGAGVHGLETAIMFHRLGAEATVFSKNIQGGSYALLADLYDDLKTDLSWERLTSNDGRSLIEFNEDLSETPSYKDYLKKYYYPVLGKISAIIKKCQVQNISKATIPLEQEEKRFMDLFRVIYQIDKHDLDQELVKAIGENSAIELQSQLEYYEDFDLVVDCTGSLSYPSYSSASGDPAVNELNEIHKGKIFYSIEALKKDLSSNKQICVVASNEQIVTFLCRHEERILSGELAIDLICNKELSEYQTSNNALQNQFNSFLKKLNELDYQYQKDFEKEYEEWDQLESYVKVKIKKPVKKSTPLRVHLGLHALSFDQLSDQEGLFITFEKDHSVQTFKCDSFLVFNGFQSRRRIYGNLQVEFDYRGLQAKNGISHPEKGVFTLDSSKGLDQIQFLEEEVLKLFSRK